MNADAERSAQFGENKGGVFRRRMHVGHQRRRLEGADRHERQIIGTAPPADLAEDRAMGTVADEQRRTSGRPDIPDIGLAVELGQEVAARAVDRRKGGDPGAAGDDRFADRRMLDGREASLFAMAFQAVRQDDPGLGEADRQRLQGRAVQMVVIAMRQENDIDRRQVVEADRGQGMAVRQRAFEREADGEDRIGQDRHAAKPQQHGGMAEPGEAVAAGGEAGQRLLPRHDQAVARLRPADIEAGGDVQMVQRQTGRAQAGRQKGGVMRAVRRHRVAAGERRAEERGRHQAAQDAPRAPGDAARNRQRRATKP